MEQDKRAGTSLGRLLRDAFDAYHALVVAKVREAGFQDITPAQAQVIAHMDGSPIRALDLAARMGISKQALSVMIAELSKKDYVALQSDPQDGRAKKIALSNRGHELKATGEQSRVIAEQMFLACLNDQQKSQFTHLLAKVVDSQSHPN